MWSLGSTSGRLIVGAVAFVAACGTDAGFDREREDFVVEVSIEGLDTADRLAIGIHPTTQPARIEAGDLQGDLLVCPVDSLGVLMPGATVTVPPCRRIEADGIDLEPTDGTLHLAIGLRTRDRASTTTLRISYRQADGYFSIFYEGQPRVFMLVGPKTATPWLSNYGDVDAVVSGARLAAGAVQQVDGHSLSIEHLGEGELRIDVDWFGERTPFLP